MKTPPMVPGYPAKVPGLWVVNCPYCAGRHTHGSGPGHRVPDCPAGTPGKDAGYVIYLLGDETPGQRAAAPGRHHANNC